MVYQSSEYPVLKESSFNVQNHHQTKSPNLSVFSVGIIPSYKVAFHISQSSMRKFEFTHEVFYYNRLYYKFKFNLRVF